LIVETQIHEYYHWEGAARKINFWYYNDARGIGVADDMLKKCI